MKRTETKFSEDQEHCIKALSVFAHGRHHLPKPKEFGNGVCVNWVGDLASFDFDRLTRLVLVAHACAVRIEIASSGPRMVKIVAHRRKHGDRKVLKFHEYHPSLADLQASAEEAKKWGSL